MHAERSRTTPEADAAPAPDETIVRTDVAPRETQIFDDVESGTIDRSSVADFQLTYFFAQQAAADDAVERGEQPHGARCPRFGRFVLLELLGRGGMGEVYRALHVRLRKLVALKMLPAERAADPRARERFQREIRIISALHHPNIVRLENAGEVDGLPYLVMEYVPGLNLAQLLERGGPVGVPDACQLVGQAAVGLAHIHEHGLVHRDLKPSNLILSTAGALKIADLGIARLADGETSITEEGMLVGDPHYISPEQADGHPADIRSDIYSLGCTLFALLAGRPPFAEAGPPASILAAHLRQPFPALSDQRDDIPSGLQRAVQRMTARDPARRFQTPAEIAQALAPFAGGCDLVGLLRRSEFAPVARLAIGSINIDSAEYLSTSGPRPLPPPRRKWIRPVAWTCLGVLLTIGMFAAYKFIGRSPADRTGQTIAENHGASTPDDPLARTSSVPVDWNVPQKVSTKESTAEIHAPPTILASVVPERDAFDADVTLDDGKLHFAAPDDRGLLQFPVAMPPEYTLDLLVERIGGEDSFGIGINAGTGRMLALIDHVVGDEPTNGLMHAELGQQLTIVDQQKGRMLPAGDPIRIQLVVTRDEVCLRIEDPLGALEGSAGEIGWLESWWRGEPARPLLSQFDAYYPGSLFLHSFKSAFLLHDLSISVPDGAPAPAPLFAPAAGPERSLAERILWSGGTVNVLDAEGKARTVKLLPDLPDDPWIIGIDDRDISPALHLTDDVLLRIAELEGLKQLDLRSSNVTDHGLQFVSDLPSLEFLGLGGSRITGAGLSRIGSLPALKKIYLNNMRIGDADVQTLTRFPTLTYLCLSSCDVTDEGVRELAGAFPDLYHLCLKFTDVEGESLASLTAFPHLRELQLTGTGVRDEHLATLLDMPSLTMVDLIGTQVTDQGVAKLRGERPELDVKK